MRPYDGEQKAKAIMASLPLIPSYEGTPLVGIARLAAQGAMIERLSSDSRRSALGVAFLAYPGEGGDGRTHIADALARGASAVIWEERDFAWRAEWRRPNAPRPI